MEEKECKCFAYQETEIGNGGKNAHCLILKKLICRYSYGECLFYKTKEQLEEEKSRTVHRLKKLDLYRKYREVYGI